MRAHMSRLQRECLGLSEATEPPSASVIRIGQQPQRHASWIIRDAESTAAH
jgi:hypothetical protein